MPKTKQEKKEDKKPSHWDMAHEIIKIQLGVKTIIPEDRTYVFDRGYYNNEGATQILKAKITARYGPLANETAIREVIGFIKRISCIKSDSVYTRKWDDYVCLENGILNLKTMEVLKPHPAMFITYKLPVFYNPNADPEIIHKYVKSMVRPAHCDKVQEHVGNIFSNHYLTKKLLYALGPQNGGKSTFYDVLMFFLGKSNYCSLNLNELGDKFTNALIYNKKANICSDIPNKIFPKYYGRIKNVTGGDSITLQFKGQNAFSYIPIAKQFFSSNNVPEVDFSQARVPFFSRFDFIDFPNSFAEKKDYFKTYTTPEMMSALLNWAIEGYSRLKENKWQITNADSVDEVVARFAQSEVTLTDFDNWLLGSYEPDDKSWMLKADLFRDCRQWHLAKEIKGFSYINDYGVFCRKMSENKFIRVSEYKPTVDGKQVKAFIGVKPKIIRSDEKSE